MKPGKANREDWVIAATIHSEELGRVGKLLKDARIPALISEDLGSSGIYVSRQDQKWAADIIEKDAKERGYWVTINRPTTK